MLCDTTISCSITYKLLIFLAEIPCLFITCTKNTVLCNLKAFQYLPVYWICGCCGGGGGGGWCLYPCWTPYPVWVYPGDGFRTTPIPEPAVAPTVLLPADICAPDWMASPGCWLGTDMLEIFFSRSDPPEIRLSRAFWTLGLSKLMDVIGALPPPPPPAAAFSCGLLTPVYCCCPPFWDPLGAMEAPSALRGSVRRQKKHDTTHTNTGVHTKRVSYYLHKYQVQNTLYPYFLLLEFLCDI